MASNRQYGFTLLELMIAIAIIGIVAAIAIPSYRQYIERGDLIQVQKKMASAVDVIKTEMVKNPSYLDSLAGINQLNGEILGMVDNKIQSKYEIQASFLCLINAKYTTNCSADNVVKVGFNIYAIPKETDYKYAAWASSLGGNYVCMGNDRGANITAAKSFQTSLPCEKK